MQRTGNPSVHRKWEATLYGWTGIGLALLLAACGAPGEPTPPSPPIPVVVTDLEAHQLGDGVLLTFTLPGKSTLGVRLTVTPTLEVLRGTLGADGTATPKSFRLVDTVPGALLGGYLVEDKVQFLDPLSPDWLRAKIGEPVVYRVRTRVSEKKASADSNDATLRLYAVPEPIGVVETTLTENDIHLKWSPPLHTTTGEALSNFEGYHVYRGELDPSSAAAAEKDLHSAVWKSPLLQIAATTAPEYQDTGFDYDKTYLYLVRSATVAGGVALESGDSRPAILTPKDIFPPAAPQGVVAVLLPGPSPETGVVELSWSINIEPDVAGYRVYRSEGEDSKGTLLTSELLPASSYRDTSVARGHHYSYRVTAVDRASNESPPSVIVQVDVP